MPIDKTRVRIRLEKLNKEVAIYWESNKLTNFL